MKKIAALLAIGMLSLTLVVLAGCGGEEAEPENKEPQNFTLEAANDGEYVKLSWTEPVDGEPDNYYVYFKEVNTTDWVVGATLAGDVLEYTHDPMGATGEYYVAAEFDAEEYDSDVETTIPVHTAEVVIYELNAAGNAGYGWEITGDFSGGTYSMAQATNADLVDFYITNFALDPGGPYNPSWSIASPELATVATDPGATFVPVANWRDNAFSNPITDPQAILPLYSNTTYFNYTDGIETDPTYIGVHLNLEDHYGLVKFTGVNVNAGTIQVESWFQTVQGLRLVAH